MIKSIAIYPHHIDIDYLNKIDFTLKLADMYGFDEIFTTVHLPEYSLSQQLDCFDAIVDKARKYGFALLFANMYASNTSRLEYKYQRFVALFGNK